MGQPIQTPQRPPGAWVMLVAVALLGLLAACGGDTATGQQPQATSTPSVQQPTPRLRPVSGPLLGGPVNAYDAAFGAPVSTSNIRNTYSAILNDHSLLITVRRDDGTGGKRAGFLDLEPIGGEQWDAATGNGIAKLLMPPDATFQRDLTIPDFGAEHVYRSASLALSFPASAFTDLQTGAAVPPGTFYYSCGNQNEPTGGCSLTLGQ